MASEEMKHLTSSEFVAGKPPEEQNKNLQEFVQPHIESFNYMLDDGLKNAVQVDSASGVVSPPGHENESSSITEQQQIDVNNENEIAMQAVDEGVTSVSETMTISIPTSTVQNLQLNVALPDSTSTVLPTDYMNILDIVLDNSKLSLQGDGMDENQAIVLAEVEGSSGHMIAVTQGVDGNPIALTPQQVSALNVVTSGGGDLSIVTSEQTSNVLPVTTIENEKTNSLIATITDMKEKLSEDPSDVTMKDDNGDDIQFEDDINDDQFGNGSSQAVDMKSEHAVTDGKVDMKFKCSECGRPYVTKAALKKHLLVIHNKEMENTLQKATSKCINPGCEKIFYHRQKMIDHLKEAHGINCLQEDLVFNSWDEFFIWKEKEEDANFVHFSKNSTHTNAHNYMLINFTCQREGKAGYKYKGSQQKKYKDLVIGEKICPARMRARLDKPTGRVTVEYCKSHNHKLSFQDFLYRRMPDRLRNEIREKLAAGMSSEEVYKELKSTDNLRENRGDRFAPSKRQFVTLVNIKTIAKRMQIKESGPPKNFVLDPEPYAIQVQKLLDETYHPVLLYKDQGVNIEVGSEEINHITGSHDLLLIGIQTKEQKEMFVKHGHKIVFIDITESVITPTLYVVTVKVLDEYNKGYPIAFLLTNSRDESVLFYFFREIQARISECSLKVSAVMTENSCNEYYAFRSVFGDHVKHLLCKWNLHRAWCQKIHEECAGDEALQQELYFIFVTMLEEQDLPKFESIATEFINNYQVRCPNFITFFMSNYLSQPEVWASCYRNNPYSDCDEILYGDRVHERIKKEIKNNHKVKSIDDILDLVLKFEHEDYFNRGLNLMLNAPEGDLVLSEHSKGMKIKNVNVVENYAADNRWLVKTSQRDPADLQSIKEDSYIVTWKADICEKDFCRERCLKLACFGLCGHLYHCSCDTVAVTPCCHIHKVHSLRIGVSQYQNEEKEDRDIIITVDKDLSASGSVTKSSIISNKDEGKLNLINQVNISGAPDPDLSREDKIKKIKFDLVKMYKFLESENIRKYSLDFIDAGLKKVIDECKIIDSIGQSKSMDSFQGKRKSPDEELEDFEYLVKCVKRKKVMGRSVPVIVEIEPNPATYNTFRKRMTGSSEETPEDRMLKLSKSKNITVNIESDDKFRKYQSQHVTSTPGIIVAKEGSCSSLKVEADEVLHQDLSDTEWTPKGSKRGRSKSKTSGKKKIKRSESNDPKILSLKEDLDPLKEIIRNGTFLLNIAQLKVLDSDLPQTEINTMKLLLPEWNINDIPEAVINSFFYIISQRHKVLFLSVEQMRALCDNEPHINRFWDPTEITGDSCCSYVFVPWKNMNAYYSLFVVDLKHKNIIYYDPCKKSLSDMQTVNTAHTTLVGLMVTEIPFDSTRVSQSTWPLTIETNIVFDEKDSTIRSMWYADQLCENLSLLDSDVSMDEFRKTIFTYIVGNCLNRIVDGNGKTCPVCKLDGGLLECCRCNQIYHISCMKDVTIESSSFVCT